MEKTGKGRLALVLLTLALPWLGVWPSPGEEARPVSLTQEKTEENIQEDAQKNIQENTQVDRPLVALTFDDGPRRSTTSELLDGLAQRGVQATFFLIGKQIEGNEDLVERMEAEGHQIGIHSFDHKILTALNATDFAAQVDREGEVLKETVGREDFPLRPPYGEVDAAVKKRADGPIILWSVDPEDWRYQDADRVTAHILDNVRDGDIILLHDIFPTSVEAALRVVDALHQRGFLFVTVGELAAQRHVELEAGKVYRTFYP